MLIAALLDSTRTFVESVRAMLAAILAAIPALEQILLREDDVPFLGVVKIVWFKFRSPEIIVHLVHICKINKTCRFKLYQR